MNSQVSGSEIVSWLYYYKVIIFKNKTTTTINLKIYIYSRLNGNSMGNPS